MTRDVHRWVVAGWLVLLLLSPAHVWARVGALVLLGLMLGVTAVELRRVVRREREQRLARRRLERF